VIVAWLCGRRRRQTEEADSAVTENYIIVETKKKGKSGKRQQHLGLYTVKREYEPQEDTGSHSLRNQHGIRGGCSLPEHGRGGSDKAEVNVREDMGGVA